MKKVLYDYPCNRTIQFFHPRCALSSSLSLHSLVLALANETAPFANRTGIKSLVFLHRFLLLAHPSSAHLLSVEELIRLR